MNTKKQSFGIFAVAMSAISFALGGILIKVNSWAPASINGMRCLFAMCVLLIYMKITHHRFVINRGVWICAFANYAMSLTFVMANKMTSAANAIVLQFTMPIFIIILQFAIWRVRQEKEAVIACAVSFIGIICFFVEKLTATGMKGNLIAVFSGFLYAIVFLSKKIKDCDFQSAVVLSFAMSFLFALPSILQESSLGGINLLSAMALGIFQQAAAYIWLNMGLDQVAPITASLISMIEPILNPVLVAVFYHETMGFMSLIGAAIVLGSALYYNAFTIRRENESDR